MKINRVACDLCPYNAPREASTTLKFYLLANSKMPGTGRGRGAPKPSHILDLCINHYDALMSWTNKIVSDPDE
jgi:hypothetical protein